MVCYVKKEKKIHRTRSRSGRCRRDSNGGIALDESTDLALFINRTADQILPDGATLLQFFEREQTTGLFDSISLAL